MRAYAQGYAHTCGGVCANLRRYIYRQHKLIT
nr:MAG TPA: hypothetical protein [Caudoviricetes sp.]